MKNYLLIIIAIFFVGCSQSEEPINDTTPEDSVQIGNQIWMKENLSLIRFSNGDEIFHASNQEEWNQAYIDKIPAWSYYEDLEANGLIYGLIYNYYAIKDDRGLAPESWKIPTISDWNKLFEYNGGIEVAGRKLKSQNYWVSESGTNESGFNALPGGERFLSGVFNDLGVLVSFWTSSLDSNGDIITVGISDIYEESRVFEATSDPDKFNRFYNLPGFYVRCIKE
ncbi:fibrobacter succinogenes major paralogous domain-containing protein [Algoriphagus persicinus]|uniref:fibrobacter succinogenes major paralogous domain-containing protein n=1 Tax=Algoriphagus persicinus TaxID=3108754 RepID=UPI002B366959|nr:fibrobacter succinogenes major paralogous domain-containing protein [Algoriphagus sp. E1-3-M2]MEB2786010.1 fibrobacter succinogenes major paralogous domain-containing protein [Algoriphagus sp. E1-3-M2]